MSNNRKIWMLLAGCFLAFLLSYKFAFEKTILLAKEVSQLEQKAIGLSELASLNMQLSQREKQVDSILSSNNLKNTSIQNGLLEYLNQQKINNSIQIVKFHQPHRFEAEDRILVSYTFDLEGSHKDLLQIIYGLEQDVAFGIVKAFLIKKELNYRSRKEYLLARITLERYESK